MMTMIVIIAVLARAIMMAEGWIDRPLHAETARWARVFVPLRPG
jgi:hypothetical protein